MNTVVIHHSCPDYQFDNLDLENVSKCIDNVLIEKFFDKKIVLRGIQSEKHNLPKEQLIQKILETGTDRDESGSIYEQRINNKPIDLFGYGCEIKSGTSLTLEVLEGFHKWKPKSLERPQQRVDIWMVYDASMLENVEYLHSMYNVKVRDGYLFKDPSSKTNALIGLIVLD